VVELLVLLQSIDQLLNPPIATSLRVNLRCLLGHLVEDPRGTLGMRIAFA
jgi:hypothetical protein